jgi:proton-translocating NADH-quinone oxidoreductase chain L
MSDVRAYLWLVPALPLFAAILTAFLGPRLLRQHSHWPCILGAAGSFVVSLLLLCHVLHHGEPAGSYYTWFEVGIPGTKHALNVQFNLLADPLTAIMCTMVTFISTFIAIYSVGYMHGEEGYPRFFAEVALFIFSMTLLVLSDNFILLYAGWEGVGLCSYLLVGFWFTKPAAADAARKAFLVTRIGDVCMMLGILLFWYFFGFSFNYDEVFRNAKANHAGNEGLVLLGCLLLFGGAAGKSAQFPFHVWLPDAMEGPTPVSALIHAATMVTAGVYLVARCTPLFVLAPEAQLTVACIGCFTALMAALIGLTQNDLKRVLAYSTLSQLGYMFLALGCAIASGPDKAPYALVTVAVVAGMFHLLTHAFFKALLFLSAGSVMHAMGGVIDMRRFSGLRKVMPITHLTFLMGALALSGFPLWSGFWSKDEILGAAFEAGTHSLNYGTIYMILFAVGVFTAGLTGFYTFRAYFLTFWGPEIIPHEAGHHAHESPRVMTVPLIVLAVFATGVGFALGPTHLFADVLGMMDRTSPWPPLAKEDMNLPLMLLSTLFAVGGIGMAWLMYVKRPELSVKVAGSVQALYQLSLNKFHFDELYEAFIIKPLDAISGLSLRLDMGLVDRLVDLIGLVPRWIGSLFRYVQNGLVQFYALAMVLGLTVFILALVRSL